MVRREIVIFRIDKLKEYLRYLEDVKNTVEKSI